MRPKVPWTKTMLEKFIDEALLSEDEEKVLRTRIAGWSIVKQSMEFQMSTATVSRIINSIKQKYLKLQPLYPEIFPELKHSKIVPEQPICTRIKDNFQTYCGKDLSKLTAEEVIKCQKNCPYDKYYKEN